MWAAERVRPHRTVGEDRIAMSADAHQNGCADPGAIPPAPSLQPAAIVGAAAGPRVFCNVPPLAAQPKPALYLDQPILRDRYRQTWLELLHGESTFPDPAPPVFGDLLGDQVAEVRARQRRTFEHGLAEHPRQAFWTGEIVFWHFGQSEERGHRAFGCQRSTQ